MGAKNLNFAPKFTQNAVFSGDFDFGRKSSFIIIILFFIKKLTNATYDKIYKLQSL